MSQLGDRTITDNGFGPVRPTGRTGSNGSIRDHNSSDTTQGAATSRSSEAKIINVVGVLDLVVPGYGANWSASNLMMSMISRAASLIVTYMWPAAALPSSTSFALVSPSNFPGGGSEYKLMVTTSSPLATVTFGSSGA
jgi:hypothetical protein